MEQVVTNQSEEEVKTKKAYIDKRTPAQIAFDKMQEKRVGDDCLAFMSHHDLCSLWCCFVLVIVKRDFMKV